MHIYNVEFDSQLAATIFAHSFDHAAEIFTAWYYARHQDSLEQFSVVRWKWNKTDPHSGLHRTALATGVPGIGYFDETRGWLIVSPDRPAEA